MGLPGHRRTSSHKRRRWANINEVANAETTCPKCGKAMRPHRACAFCGTYRGRKMMKSVADRKAA